MSRAQNWNAFGSFLGQRRTPTWLRPARRWIQGAIERWARLGVPRIVPRVLRRLPHDTHAFTQGLAYHGGFLYESTGGDSQSSLRRLDPDDGRVLEIIPVPGTFAEGIAILGDRLFQLTWQSGTALVYRFPELTRIETKCYTGEGWGLAAWRDRLIRSDGTSRLHLHSPSFQPVGGLHVHSRGVPVRGLNDLECVGQLLYANLLGRDHLAVIDLESGRLVRTVACSELFADAAPRKPSYEVLNGITYRPDTDTFFVTGKNWKYLFEIIIPDQHIPTPSSRVSDFHEDTPPDLLAEDQPGRFHGRDHQQSR